jgi:hypothetical protein
MPSLLYIFLIVIFFVNNGHRECDYKLAEILEQNPNLSSINLSLIIFMSTIGLLILIFSLVIIIIKCKNEYNIIN